MTKQSKLLAHQLNSLKVENYRNLKSFEIAKLGQVNLFLGKNNVGKTALLEAVSIYANKGNRFWIIELLKRRGLKTERNFLTDGFEIFVQSFLDIFTDKKYSGKTLRIGETDSSNQIRIELKLMLIKEDGQRSFEPLDHKETEVSPFHDELELMYESWFTTKQNKENKLMNQLTMQDIFDRAHQAGRFKDDEKLMRCHLINTNEISAIDNSVKYDNVLLMQSKFEENIIEALKIIEPNITRIFFVGDRERSAIVKVGEKVLPLKSMGDGINRILTIILALINSKDGFLLIDEFENGLHYSVQEKLWEVIFKLALDLNVQVFVTSHSNDGFSSFVKTKQKYESMDACCFRMENVKGKAIAKSFTDDSLNAALELDGDFR